MTEPPVIWNRLTAEQWAAMFPAKPQALRKIAYAFRKLGAGDEPFTVAEWELAKVAGVSPRTIRRYLGVFERYGVIEVNDGDTAVLANGRTPIAYFSPP